MEFNSKLLDGVCYFFGYAFSGETYPYAIVMRVAVLIMQSLLVIQSAIFFVLHDSLDSASAQSFYVAIIVFQGIFKTFTAFASHQKIKELKKEIECVCDKISYQSQQKFTKEFRNFKNLVNIIFLNTFFFCLIFYIIMPLIKVFICYLNEVEFPQEFIFYNWFPFDPKDYFIAVRVYNLTIVLFGYHCILAVEGYALLTFCQLSVLFRSLAEDIVDVIDEYNEKEAKLTEIRLIAKIKLHVELHEITRELAEMFGVAWLAHTLGFVVSTCFMLLKAIVVDTGSDVVMSMAVIFIVSNYFFYICYIGEKVSESVNISNMYNKYLCNVL